LWQTSIIHIGLFMDSKGWIPIVLTNFIGYYKELIFFQVEIVLVKWQSKTFSFVLFFHVNGTRIFTIVK